MIKVSVYPSILSEVPAQTAEVATLAFPKAVCARGSVKRSRPLFTDQDFAGVFQR
ncbi:hypothetical protein H9Y04_45140 [Streptomyces sp. TRM66268-LWL]|uniref:Uncharacterized protein n=1 Tax=Streptomyces polyasparticus TaxID=2767826 RepID=A0ABR7SYE6_9ACTN|nr:hypothetical protein [Streptomyces polyasparticus]MBC9719667.1 hypothetical protein [Streptomyces polyasparticus]